MSKTNENTTLMLDRAASIVQGLTANWAVLKDNNAEEIIPRFQHSELKLGRVLGRGGYCVVNEITSVSLCETNETTSQSINNVVEFDDGFDGGFDPNPSDVILQDRNFIATKCIRDGGARYCIKKISKETEKDSKRFLKGVIDLVIELKILAVLKHPHIIKMRAVAEGNPYRRDNFLLLDRLYDTMASRLVKWTKEANKPWNKLKKKKEKLLQVRAMVALDLSSAFKYLHKQNIIYRDLKPDNIGFDVRDDVKLFDFGLSKELPVRSDDTDETLYLLSGQTGSLRYMAPEVALGKPYNLKVDVYSFSILLWEILALTTPFAGYNVRMHRKMVVESNARPKLDKKIPDGFANIMRKGWNEDIKRRFTFDELHEDLGNEVYKEDGQPDSMMDASSRTARSL